jgi:hypothetical protein
MTLKEARAAVRAYLAAHWSATPLFWPNEISAAPVGADAATPLWTLTEFINLAAFDAGFGSAGKRHARDDGIVWGHFFAAVMTGEDAAYQAAFDFGEMLRLLRIDGGLQFYAPQVMTGELASDDGNWWRVSVKTPWSLFRAI